MPKDRPVKANASKQPAPQPVAQSTDNDWWSWVLIAVIFAVSAAVVWGPVIAGAV
jgi:hypothetical protein